MSDWTDLKRVALAIAEGSPLQGAEAEEAMHAFECAATPDVVLELIAENERLAAELDCPFRLARHSKRLVEKLREENEALRKALKSAEDAMWHADGNMDGEAADARNALAAAGKVEQS